MSECFYVEVVDLAATLYTNSNEGFMWLQVDIDARWVSRFSSQLPVLNKSSKRGVWQGIEKRTSSQLLDYLTL